MHMFRTVFLALLCYGVITTNAHAAVAAQPPVAHDAVLLPHGTPRGIMLTVHGGGWLDVGEHALAMTRPEAAGFAAQGWIVYNIDYRQGGTSLSDVVAATRWAKARYTQLPLCLYGASAGGQLALVAATIVSGVACVITQGAPTDLVNWHAALSNRMGIVANAKYFFGARGAATITNPVWLATHHHFRHTRLLLVQGTQDKLVEASQAARLCSVAPHCSVAHIRPGAVPFTHGFGAAHDLLSAWHRAAAMLTAVAR